MALIYVSFDFFTVLFYLGTAELQLQSLVTILGQLIIFQIWVMTAHIYEFLLWSTSWDSLQCQFQGDPQNVSFL